MKRLVQNILPSKVWTGLRLFRLRHSIRSYRKRRVVHRYCGFELEIELMDPLSEGWYDHDWPESKEIDFLKRNGLGVGSRVFDVGAHQCVVASVLGRIVGPSGSVIALEANGHNATAGRRNTELNKLDNVVVVHAAAAGYSGRLDFNLGLNGNVVADSADWGRCDVACFSIDDLSDRFGVPDVLFIDVEGYECQVLEGARQTLTNGPNCFVEVHLGAGLEGHGGSLSRVLSFFPEERYKIFAAPPEGQEFHPLDDGYKSVAERFFLIALAKRDPKTYESLAVRR